MKIIKIVLSTLFILGGIGVTMQGSIISGVLSITLGALLIPQVGGKLKKSYSIWKIKSIRYGIYFVLFMLVGILNNETKNNFPNNTIQSTIKQEPKNTIRFINLDKKYYDGKGNVIEPNDNDITYRVVEKLEHLKNKGRIKDADTEIITLLIDANRYGEKIIKHIAEELKRKYSNFAPNKCVIDLWNNKDAYLKYLEREKYFSKSFEKLMEEFKRTRVPIANKYKELQKKWDKSNYIFIANHQVGILDLNGSFSYFPLKDDYYKEISKKTLKK